MNYFKKNEITKHWIRNIIIAVIVILFLNIVMNMVQELFPIYNSVEYFRILPIAVLSVIMIFISLITCKYNIKKIMLVLFIILISFLSWRWLNSPKDLCNDSCDSFKQYELKYLKYKKQLKDMKNSLSVKAYSKAEEPIGIFFFGMADRKKILYKDGQLIDIKTKEVIKEIDYEKELIVPNEYAVILKDKENNIFKIIEDTEGIKFYKNGEEEILCVGKKKINLPTFKDYKYSEILKVLHQEILFNIDNDIPKPNIFVYNNAWYRDTMLATMVLEKTENVSLLNEWVSTINKIYDNSRSADINEIDNLGELLYIIGATNSSRQDLIDQIMAEIKSLTKDSMITGQVDGMQQSYFPTVLAIYGAKKNGITLDLIPPTYDDGYARLTWYADNKISTSIDYNSSTFPYLNWAFYHYTTYGNLYVLDEIYPLTYEGGNVDEFGKVESECFISDYYCNRGLYLSHMWHASEMFLSLIEK